MLLAAAYVARPGSCKVPRVAQRPGALAWSAGVTLGQSWAAEPEPIDTGPALTQIALVARAVLGLGRMAPRPRSRRRRARLLL